MPSKKMTPSEKISKISEKISAELDKFYDNSGDLKERFLEKIDDLLNELSEVNDEIENGEDCDCDCCDHSGKKEY